MRWAALALVATGAFAGTPFEAKMIDGSVAQFELLVDQLELVTPFGPLKLPVNQVRRIELATRPRKDLETRLAAAIENLGNPDAKVRAAAEADLKGLGPRAYAALYKAANGTNAEAARHAIAISREIPGLAAGADAPVREVDVVEVDASRIAGKLAADTLAVRALAFGDQQLKLADVDELTSRAPQATGEPPTPGKPTRGLTEFTGQFGTVRAVMVSPAPFPARPGRKMMTGGSAWGTDVYTLDSDVSTAAVHAGVMEPGQSGFVRVKILESPPSFRGSARNGVTTQDYGAYPTGAFEFVR